MCVLFKRFAFLAVLAIALLSGDSHVCAEDLLTSDGVSYKGIRVTGETPDKVRIIHDSGISLVSKHVIPKHFLISHELTLPPEIPGAQPHTEPDKLEQFKRSVPTFKTRDGTEYKSSDITKIEPDGLKLVTSSGILKIKFDNLLPSVKNALGYDAAKAQTYADEQKKKQAEYSDYAVRMANATSYAETFSSNVRLQLLQQVNKGWSCAAEVIEDVEREVVTARQGSPFSGPRTVYESSKKVESVVVAGVPRLMVFGLPSYSSMPSHMRELRQWSGKVYKVGQYRFVAAGTGDEALISAVHVDQRTAISWLMKNGNSAVYGSDGDVSAQEAVARAGTGTGFAISDEGHIATAAHVVDGAGTIEVMIDGTAKLGRVIACHNDNDVAVVKVDDVKTKALPLGRPEILKLGMDLMCVGYPLVEQLGVNPKLTKGSLNALSGLSDDYRMIQMSVQVQAGNSGGPVCDGFGRVIGIVSRTGSTIAASTGRAGAVPQNVNFAMKTYLLMDLVQPQVPNLKWAEDTTKLPFPEEAVLASTYLIKVK